MNETKGVAFTVEDWKHFCSCIDWKKTFLDARAITIMNKPIEVSIKGDEKIGMSVSSIDIANKIKGLTSELDQIKSQCDIVTGEDAKRFWRKHPDLFDNRRGKKE